MNPIMMIPGPPMHPMEMMSDVMKKILSDPAIQAQIKESFEKRFVESLPALVENFVKEEGNRIVRRVVEDDGEMKKGLRQVVIEALQSKELFGALKKQALAIFEDQHFARSFFQYQLQDEVRKLAQLAVRSAAKSEARKAKKLAKR